MPSDKAFTVSIVAGTSNFFDNNSFGINYFDVTGMKSARDVSQTYTLLQGVTHMERSEGAPTGCPNIYAH
jgi:hypothetical protein